MKIFFTLLFIACAFTTSFAQANFTPDKDHGCPPLVVNFTDQSTITPITWQWNFGNGNTSSLQNPSAAYLNPGLYSVTLIVSNGTQTDTVTKTIRVYQPPTANFTVNKPNACTNDTLYFTNLSTPGDTGISNYAWGFGNGVASNSISPVYVYSQPGLYNVTLVVSDSNGCSANKTVQNYIKVNQAPTAAFSATPQHSCVATQTVNFTNQSTGGNLTYYWSLGDSTYSTLTNPSHTYTQEIQKVILYATDSNGCTSAASLVVKVTDIIANFKASAQVVCTNQKVQFTNTSNFPGTSWYWDFGDGTNSTDFSPIKTYAAAGKYTVSLVVTDAPCGDSVTKVNYISVVSGFPQSSATFTATNTNSCGSALPVNFTNTTPGGATWHWDFGDGDTSNQQNPSTIYANPGNYTVTLTVTDSNGCSITGIIPGMITSQWPVAIFKADTLTCLGAGTHFNNLSTNAQNYFWDFGDGDTSRVAAPWHLYLHYGYYTVKLTAFNVGGCDSTTTMVNYIHIDSVHVGFQVNNTFSPCPPFACTMQNTSQNGLQYLWDFGDGYTDTATNPTHIYFYPGVYTVKLVGYNSQGCEDSVTAVNLITVQGPTGNFVVAPTTGCQPLTVNFSATTSSNTKSAWCDLGDGNVIPDTLIFSHIYNSVHVYHPRWVLTDHVGCTVAYPLDSIIVSGTPLIQGKDTAVCPAATINITLDSSNHYQWSPPDYLSCDTCSSVFINPRDSVSYQVTATSNAGCQATVTFNVGVVPLPILAGSQTIPLCQKDSFQLFVGSASRIAWSPSLYLSDSTIANPICSPLLSTTYTVTAYNILGCSISTTVPVEVKSKIDITLPQEVQVCSGSSVELPTTLVFGTILGVHYQWTPASYLNDPNIATPTATMGDQNETFQVIATGGHCIPDTQTVIVNVNAIPDLVVSSGVTTTPGAEVQLYADSHQELNYKWLSQDSLSCANCRVTDVFPTKSQFVVVEGTNSMGCTARDSVAIEVQGCDANKIFLPNTFTPNGDGLNDKFYVRSNSLSSLKFFRIYDEWGQLVFQTENLDEGWDGSVAGKAAPTAVYVYVLEGQCQNGSEVRKSGNVTAVR